MTALLVGRFLRAFWPYIASALATLAIATLIWRAPWAEARGRAAAVAKYQPAMDRALNAINTSAPADLRRSREKPPPPIWPTPARSKLNRTR